MPAKRVGRREKNAQGEQRAIVKSWAAHRVCVEQTHNWCGVILNNDSEGQLL
jgi:hypothetical protein